MEYNREDRDASHLKAKPWENRTMAAGELTGATAEELQDLKDEYRGTPNDKKGIPFHEAYCLSRIGKQPEDYDGPQRYCKRRAKVYYTEDDEKVYAPCCPFHGGRSHKPGTEEHLDPLANMTHGFYALEESMLTDLSDEERVAYDHIIEKGADEGITPDEDFFAYENLVSLALNIVTDTRIRRIINEEGVTRTVNIFNEGALVDQQDEEHHLLGIGQKQRKLILRLEDELALTRKHKDEMEAVSEGNSVEILLDRMGDAFEEGEQDYNPDDWEERPDDGG